GAVDRRDGERDVEPPAVRRHPLRAKALDVIAVTDLREQRGDLAVAFGERQDRGVLADRLLGRVAVELLGGLVPAHDRAVEAGGDDRVPGRRDDRGDGGGVVLALARLCVQLLEPGGMLSELDSRPRSASYRSTAA